MGVKAELSIRKIDGAEYEEVLKDVSTFQYYEYALPFTENVCRRGHKIWHSENDPDGWELLWTAVLSLAVKEYVQALISERETGRPVNWKQECAEFIEEYAPDLWDRLCYEVRMANYKGIRCLERLEKSIRVLW